MKILILKKILQQHGFKQEDIEISQDKIKLTIKDVNRQELKEEGVPIPNIKDAYYHNYIYPEGFISDIEKIEVAFYPRNHPFAARLNTIKVPLTLYRGSAETTNISYSTHHTIKKDSDSVLITIDYSQGRGNAPANEMVTQLISDAQPRIASSEDISRGFNYISDVGRIAPLVGLGIQKEVKDMLLNKKQEGSLLQLRDRLVDASTLVTTRVIALDLAIFNSYIEKLVREEGYLVQLVRNYLNLDQKNWILADQDLLNNYLKNNDANAEKLKFALHNKREPLFISTTTGSHAFAVKVDFASNTLFLANPGLDQRNCDVIITQLKQMTGCSTVVHVITKKLIREQDIPFDDVCAIDSLTLSQMMLESEHLHEGCLNNTPLRTGQFVREALGEPTLFPEQPLQQENTNKNIAAPANSLDCNLTMQIVSGFITCLGIATVAIAFTVLNAATLGIGGLVFAGVGAAAILAGIGLFAVESRKDCEKTSSPGVLPHQSI